MRVGYIPVDLGEVFFVLKIERFSFRRTWVVVVYVTGYLSNTVKFRLGDKYFVNCARTDSTSIVQIDAVILFVSSVEEQLVFKNGTANLETITGLFIGLRFDSIAFQFVTTQ